jgi:hypothetical protein
MRADVRFMIVAAPLFDSRLVVSVDPRRHGTFATPCRRIDPSELPRRPATHQRGAPPRQLLIDASKLREGEESCARGASAADGASMSDALENLQNFPAMGSIFARHHLLLFPAIPWLPYRMDGLLYFKKKCQIQLARLCWIHPARLIGLILVTPDFFMPADRSRISGL